MSTAPIPAGAELLCCPHSCALSISAARKAFPQSFIDAVTPHGLLCFFLAQQRILGEKSFYAPYINVLPKEFTTPLYFDEKDMEFLQGTNLGEEDIEQRRRTWKKEWGAGVEALKQAGIESGEYTWYVPFLSDPVRGVVTIANIVPPGNSSSGPPQFSPLDPSSDPSFTPPAKLPKTTTIPSSSLSSTLSTTDPSPP